MDFLSAAGLRLRSLVLTRMPSWGTKLDSPKGHQDFLMLNRISIHQTNERLYQASKQKSAYAELSTSGNLLYLKGKIIVGIGNVGQPFSFIKAADHGESAEYGQRPADDDPQEKL